MRNLTLFSFLISSCASISPADQARRDSMHADSIARAIGDSMSAAMAASPAPEIDKNNFPLFTSYPEIIQKGKSAGDFIPDGWMIKDSVGSDLNGDARNDFAIILQHKDSVRLVDVANDFVDTVLTQPRMVMIILWNNSDAQFHLSAQNHFFIPNHDRSTMEDPFQSMEVEKGILQFSFQYFANIGSYQVSNLLYKFRCDNGEFVLIGGEYSDFMRNMGNEEKCSYNFLTQKMKITTGGNVFDPSQKEKVTWETFDLEKMRTLDQMQPPGTWEVKKGHYL
jgi:hypothetical protein